MTHMRALKNPPTPFAAWLIRVEVSDGVGIRVNKGKGVSVLKRRRKIEAIGGQRKVRERRP